ncbi:MAG: hypothetical protein JWP63_3322, partial [Candidatus Solibacter sp.]|nr:hypothetical protein [Candidatus Solibacter sp.]
GGVAADGENTLDVGGEETFAEDALADHARGSEENDSHDSE